MGLGPFVLISLFYAVIGVRVVRDIVRRRRQVFDRRFTESDRRLVDQAAFFILVPISVALHELGHAVAVWSFGGRVTDFGYYVFAGFVAYREPFSDAQQIVVALAGSFVNVLLSGAAIALVLLRRPPMRAAYNELLLQFALLSGFNALVFYPLIDLASGMNGDWSQIYRGGVPALSLAILVVHLAILSVIVWAWRTNRTMAFVNRLTGVPAGSERGLLGGTRPLRDGMAPIGPNGVAAPDPAATALREAGRRVASGWSVPVQVEVRPTPSGSMLTLVWQHGMEIRGVLALAAADGSVVFQGAGPVLNRGDGTEVRLASSGTLSRFPAMPNPDQLTLALRLAMEEVDRWQPAGVAAARPTR